MVISPLCPCILSVIHCSTIGESGKRDRGICRIERIRNRQIGERHEQLGGSAKGEPVKRRELPRKGA